MAGLNVAQIQDQARAMGRNLSDSEASQILSQAWDQSQYGADPGKVTALLGGGSTGGGPLDDINKIIQDSFQSLQNDVVKKFGDYTTGNPFKVDQVLASKATEAHEQIDPYYNQILGDYMTGVQRKIDRGTNDTKDLLGELTASTDSYNMAAQNTLTNALTKARQGYANSGLINSGDALNTEGQLTQNTNQDLSDTARKAALQSKQITLGNSRNIEDINAAAKDYTTNIAQNQFTDVQNRASQLTNEAGKRYIQGFQATLPPQLQAASGFDMLKSLGIYS